jgi:DNA polymerase
MWQELADAFTRRAQQNAPTVAYRLPSGRVKRYFNPKLQKVAKIVVNEEGKREERVETAISGQFTRAGERKFLNGGKLCENLTQASCRDIMAYSAVEIERVHPNWRYVFNVYDEIVVEVPVRESDLAQEEIPRIMTHGELISDWTEGLPLEVEGGIFERYTK